VQLARSLRSDIVSGKLSSGERIPTTAELARRTGVSSITVNLAIAELVREGMLSRRPKLGTFVTGRTPKRRAVSIVAPLEARGAGGDGFVMSLFRSLKAALADEGCAVSVVPCSSSSEFSSVLPLVGPSAGIALVGPVDVAFVHAVRKAGKPIVVMDTPGAHTHGVDSVVVDNVGLARTAATKLIDAGHRRIVYFGMGPRDPDNNAQRLDGYRSALKAARIGYSSRLVLKPSTEKPSEEIARVLKATDATAIFLANSGFYESALRAARALKMSVPADLSVTCFGRGAGVPRPTAVNVDPQEMGRRAAQRLVKRVEGDTSGPLEELVPGWFEKGETLAPPRRKDSVKLAPPSRRKR
jgi:DNA-binding LacI/PurR family transcriptional regulator